MINKPKMTYYSHDLLLELESQINWIIDCWLPYSEVLFCKTCKSRKQYFVDKLRMNPLLSLCFNKITLLTMSATSAMSPQPIEDTFMSSFLLFQCCFNFSSLTLLLMGGGLKDPPLHFLSFISHKWSILLFPSNSEFGHMSPLWDLDMLKNFKTSFMFEF